MKKNLPVTQVERTYHPTERLISETDLKGIITIANASFCEVSGFTAEELVGKSHNVVRHPDVPPELFADLWRTIQAGERWSGMVKNRCKNGDYYWVKAVISPVVQDGRIVRYRSVRRQPTREEVSQAEELYRRIAAGEKGLADSYGRRHRRLRLGDRLGTGGQLGVVAGWPVLLALGLLAGASAGVPAPYLWGAAGLGVLVAALLVRAAFRWITGPLDELARAVTAFEGGDLSARAAVDGQTRHAELAREMNRALDGVEVVLSDMGQLLDGLARGEFDRRIVTTLPGELGSLKTAANSAMGQIEKTVKALNDRLADLAEGRLAVGEEQTVGSAGMFLQAQENARTAAVRLAGLLAAMSASARAMAEGDLTCRIDVAAAGELEALRSRFHQAQDELSGALQAVRTNAQQVAEATGEISNAIGEIAGGAETQMTTVEAVTASVRESGATLASLAAEATNADAKAQETVATVRAGRVKMERMVQVVQAIRSRSEQISKITGVIEGIARKTNLLSLNAAIEAARAGESGRGFAVVAQEVGQLAANSARSAQEIAALLAQAVSEAQNAEEAVAAVAADSAHIEATALGSSALLNRITAAMEEQCRTLERIGDHARELSTIAESNAAATEELAASSGEVARLAQEAHRQADQFRTVSVTVG